MVTRGSSSGSSVLLQGLPLPLASSASDGRATHVSSETLGLSSGKLPSTKSWPVRPVPPRRSEAATSNLLRIDGVSKQALGLRDLIKIG